MTSAKYSEADYYFSRDFAIGLLYLAAKWWKWMKPIHQALI
ncbi:hypothetical protein SAMN05216420_11541 [Nitrosospira sp. Nl5]|nr:hypothetical protein SAMN05216420_11541 [Nitrosospira sp. Nl5]